MSNSSPTQSPEFLAQQASKRDGERLGKVIGIRFPVKIDALLQAMPDKTDFIRQLVIEKLARDSAARVEVEVEATAPKVDPAPTKERRSQKGKASSPQSKIEPDELKPEQLIHNPAGWRGWVDKSLGGDRYQVTFENGLTDDYPRHLLRLQEG